MDNKCKMCGGTIKGKDFIQNKKFSEILSTKDNKINLTEYCGKCVKRLLAVYDIITTPQKNYDWRGCKAKLNYDRIMRSEIKVPSRLEFINANKDETFTLCLRNEPSNKEDLDRQLSYGLYIFKELPNMVWSFHCTDLIITKDGKERKVQ